MPTLCWYLAYMHCKDQQGQFFEEVKRCVGQPPFSNTNLSNVLTSELLHAGLKETLRLHGHNISPRILQDDTVLKIQGNEYILKKGTVAFSPSTLLNLNPDVFKDPEKWEAERFLENRGPHHEENGTKYDIKKLKIPLLIWGAGTHAVKSFQEVDTD
jgi:cytochrome P450